MKQLAPISEYSNNEQPFGGTSILSSAFLARANNDTVPNHNNFKGLGVSDFIAGSKAHDSALKSNDFIATETVL